MDAQKAPIVPDHLFTEINTPLEDQVERRFQPWVIRELHPFLNSLPCLADLQKTRRKWKSRTGSPDAFGTFKADPGHWYSFNHGGRNEAQLNLGMFPEYFRVGIGFEFTEKRGGDPSEVTLAYTAFRDITSSSDEYANLVAANSFEVEFFPTRSGQLGYASTHAVQGWEPPAAGSVDWIFFGRLLRRGADRDILENYEEFGSVLRTVLCGLRPFWARAQVRASEWK